MNEKPRRWWLLIAFILSVWVCMLFTAGTVVFATHVDEDLIRYPGCQFVYEPVWQYRDTIDYHPDKITYMSQRDRATYVYFCAISIT